MAGIYFATNGNEVTLGGYLRVGGAVEVLGLICVSIEMRMQLNWISSSGKLEGIASIIVEIELFFFEESVEISCRRTFAGSAGDPTFAQIMGPEKDDPAYFPWREYCQAFA
jgi:hypothetical protein